MKIPYFCCIGAELKRYAQDFDFMNQVYLYKLPADDTMEEVLAEDYFKAISDSVLQDDIVYIYEASAKTLHECRFDKQNGHITAIPLTSDETLTGAVTSIIHDNLTPNKLLKSDENGKVAVSDLSLEDFVKKDGTSTMTGPLKMRATSSFQCAIAPFWDGVGFYKLNNDDSVTLIASIETPDGFVPWVTNTYNIGSSLKKWKNLYLAGTAYITKINNGYDLLVPDRSGTLATKEEVDLAANSGRMITDQGVWYAKMYAATMAPAAENGTNYADFSQTDGQGNPIIVIYERQNGAWVQSETITPPAEYDGYVPITSKIWDIAEQDGQQGGRILWNHQSKEFTPYPTIISLEGGSGLNVGDIFLTMRNDNELNGAVECDGATYNTTDFTGAQSIGQLLAAGKVPYVSMTTYATEISTKGWCDKFGWDGTGNIQFKVPTLSAYVWQKLQLAIKGSVGSGGGGTYFVATGSSFTQQTYPGAGGYSVSVTNDQTIPGASVDITSEDVSQQRCMVQLATSASDEALETCTGVLADVAANTAAIAGADYVVESQLPTAVNNYTWYRKYKSGWVEQGGYIAKGAAQANTVTFSIPFAAKDYIPTVTGDWTGNTAAACAVDWSAATTTQMVVTKDGTSMGAFWKAEGMAAS